MEERSKLIVLLPGVMGSNLNMGKYQVWPRYFPDNIGVYEFYLPIGRMDIKPAGVMDYIYSKLYESLIANNEYLVEPFPYDWRKSNLDNIERLHELLLRHTDKEEIVFVAHSMGGIVSKLFLSKYKEEEYTNKISKLITLGTPWYGSMEAYKTLLYGAGLPFEKFPIVLTSEVSKMISRSFPSVYQLLPHTEYFKRVKDIHNISAITVNDNELNDWKSIYSNEIEKHFVECQSNSNEVLDGFHEKLHEEPINIEHHEIIGIGNLTLSAIKRNNFGETSGYFKNGDGTVPLFSATSETTNKYYIPGVSHQKLPKEEVVHNVINKILNEEIVLENDYVFLTEEKITELGFMGKIIRIACPVKISLIKDGKSIYGLSDDMGYENIDDLIDPSIEVVKLGKTVYLLMHEDETDNEEKIIIEAYDKGPTTVSIEQYAKGSIVQTALFETFNIDNNISAELKLSKEIKDSILLINNEENENIPLNASVQETEIDLSLPDTNYSLSYSRGETFDNMYICSGEVKVIINDINSGTYDIKDTYVRLRDEDIRLIDNEFVLNLEAGENSIEIFSTDVFGNVENPKKILVYYVNEFKPSINIEVLPHQYEVKIEHNFHYFKICKLCDFPEPIIRFEIENTQQRRHLVDQDGFQEQGEHQELDVNENTGQQEQEVFVVNHKITIITNNPKQRNIKIYYESVLGSIEENFLIEEFHIDENSVNSIFDGIGGANNLQEILAGIGIQNPTEVKLYKVEGYGIYKTLTDQNINNSRRIVIASENKKLELIKGSDYIPIFYNLDESIEIEEVNKYKFRLRIIDKEGKDIRSLEISAFLKIQIENSDTRYTDEVNVPFNQQSDSYEGELDLSEVQNILVEYWENTPIQSAELIITKSGVNSSIIRVKEIKIRRSRS